MKETNYIVIACVVLMTLTFLKVTYELHVTRQELDMAKTTHANVTREDCEKFLKEEYKSTCQKL